MLPLWGVIRPDEFSNGSVQKVLEKIYRAKSTRIEDFLHSFESFLHEIILGGENCNELANSIIEMHEFFQNNDYRTVMRNRKVWDMFSSFVESDDTLSKMSVLEAIEICRALSRYLQVLTVPLPECDLVHSSIAGVAGFLGLIAKIRDGIPFILTEHGVYYRERLLEHAGRYSEGPKQFWVNFEKAIARISYTYADLIVPVSKFNAFWESQLGADPNKIDVIYNGVDTEKFRPMAIDRISNKPTVGIVTRIDRLKGILDLIAAMATVRDKIPLARCLVFGSAIDPSYAQTCLETRERLGLTRTVLFMGFTKDTPAAFNLCDVVALPSISEGFPYSLIEGMSCGKATVATNVGGVTEALADTGIVVPPRDPLSLGEALAQLLTDPLHAKKLGLAARDRTLSEYTVSKFTEKYREVYREMLMS